MPDAEVAEHVNKVLEYIAHTIKFWEGEPLPHDYHVVISLERLVAIPYAAFYYLASVRDETIFWLEDYRLGWEISQMLQAKLEPQMLGIFLKYQFL